MPFFLPFPSLENRGAVRGRRRWPSPAAGRRGKKEEGSERRRSPAVARPEMDRGGLATAAGDADRGGATVELGGGPELGEKGKGGKGVLMRPLPWAQVKRGGGSVVAGGA